MVAGCAQASGCVPRHSCRFGRQKAALLESDRTKPKVVRIKALAKLGDSAKRFLAQVRAVGEAEQPLVY